MPFDPSSISTWISLAAALVLVLFVLFKVILERGIWKPISGTMTAKIVEMLISRVFWLVVLVLVIAGGLELAKLWIPPDGVPPAPPPTVEEPTPTVPEATTPPTIEKEDETPGPTDVAATQTAQALAAQMVIDDFEGYGSDEALRLMYSINTSRRKNVGELSLASPPNVGEGSQAVAFYYEIKNPEPHNYSGFQRDITPAQDWSGYGHLCFWVRSDDLDRDLTIQFREARRSEEVWRHIVNLSDYGEEDFKLTLDESTFEWAEDLSDPQNGRIDLDAIDYYGFFVSGGLGQGTIYVDDLRVCW